MPFKKGFDPHRNIKGRPSMVKSLDEIDRKKDKLSAITSYMLHLARSGDTDATLTILEFYKKRRDGVER